MRSKKIGAAQNRCCHSCNKTFSKAEHLTRHLRSHTKERPYGCSTCGKLYSRSDVLRRHEKSHRSASPLSPDHPGPGHHGSTTMFTPLSQKTPQTSPLAVGFSSTFPGLSDPSPMVGALPSIDAQPALGMSLREPIPNPDPDSWFFGSDLDVDALDFTLSAAVSEWAQLPLRALDVSTFCPPTPVPSGSLPINVREPQSDLVKKRWFSRLTVQERARTTQEISTNHSSSFAADENYRADLSQTLQPRMHDEALPSADQLNLFANLFFGRFNALLPIVHSPSFKPTRENSLLFISICSVGSLFAGCAAATAQGTRLFERLNKAILASWESILSHSRSDALSMVQAAVIGQTFAILSGRPKTLILADVLHGTVMAWARESNKNAQQSPDDPQSLDPARGDLEDQWTRWIDCEQRKRVEIALNIHDAELATLLHHEPLRRHRLTQHPHASSDALFTAPTAARWAELYRTTPTPYVSLAIPDDPLQDTVVYSRYSGYGVLESINAYIVEARRSNTLDQHESRRLSNMLMRWWRIYTNHFAVDPEDDPFNLPVLWHSSFIALYADVDILEQACGRDGETCASSSAPLIRSWVRSQDASRCLVHALLIRRYLERLRVASEPAIHVPRALFTAALAWFCFTRVGGGQMINATAFDAPEIQLVGGVAFAHDPHGLGFDDAKVASPSHLHRMIDLLGRLGRWGISQSFSSVLCAALNNTESA